MIEVLLKSMDTTPLSIMNQYIKIISGQYKPIRRTYMNEGISDLLDESEASQASLLIPNRLRSSRDLLPTYQKTIKTYYLQYKNIYKKTKDLFLFAIREVIIFLFIKRKI